MRKLAVLFVLLLTGALQMAFAQKTVSGKVSDDTNAALPGVSIIVKGTTTGTVSDASGNYSIPNVAPEASLLFSFIGMQSQEIKVGTQTVINVVMVTDAIGIGEVVAYGYGTVKKTDLTGAIGSVKGDELVKLPVMRSDQALQGQAAGVVVTNTDGAPGGNTTIRIRGSNSITGGNNALVVVDGFQGGNLSTINPNEIESIEVLKDASATAIYGSRGANGVIIVTTKKGKTGAPVVKYDFSFGVQNLANKLDLMDGGQYAQKSNDYKATLNRTGTPTLPFTQAQIDELNRTGGTDWQDEVFRSANLMMHQLSVSGGTEKTKYFVAGGYYDQEGLVINSFFKRFSLRSTVDIDVAKWLTTGVSMSSVIDRGNVPPYGEGTRYVDILGQVINAVPRMDPASAIYDENGNYTRSPRTYGDPDVWNPVATAMGTYNESKNANINLNGYLLFRIAKGLTLKVNGAADVTNNGKRTYYSHITQNGEIADGVGELNNEVASYFQNSNILTYDTRFAEKHHLTLTGVAETQLQKSNGSWIYAEGFFSDETGINDLGQASSIPQKSSFDTKRVINSFMGRAFYSFDEKYLLTVSYRADGASVFGANNKWGYFPSTSLAWRMSEEEFIKSLNLFSDLKLRGSWGITGNQAITPYKTLDAIGSGYSYPYNGTGATDVGYAALRPTSPNLKWETTTQTNFGLDLGFFSNRLTANIDVYKKLTDDLLLEKPLPSYTGFPTMIDNVGSVENKGLEITVSGNPFVKDFKWNTSVNLTFNRSKVISLLEGQTMMPIKTNTGGGYQIWNTGQNNALMNLEVGEPFGVMRGYVNLGVWSEAERADAAKYGQLPGDLHYKDVNDDGKITTADLTRIGNASPDYIFGWNNNFSYKNFSLSFLIQGSQGNDIFNATRIKTEDQKVGASTKLLDRWTIDNQNTDIPAFIDQKTRDEAGLTSKVNLGSKSYNRQSRFVEDGSYVRLKNVTFGYDLPTQLISKIGINNFKVYASVTNLLTLTNYSGYDPEVSSYNVGTDAAKGIDISNYPTARTVTFGINVTF